MEVDDTVLTGATFCDEVDDTVLTGATSCDVVLEQTPPGHDEVVVTAPLFVPRYITRPIIATMAMTTAATTAAENPTRDSNLITLDHMLIVLNRYNAMPRLVQSILLKGSYYCRLAPGFRLMSNKSSIFCKILMG